jgi:hypothetical protein
MVQENRRHDLSDDGSNLDPAVLSTAAPQDFFRDLLSIAVAHQRAKVHDETLAYLVNLLSGSIEADPELNNKPLAFLLKDALEEEGPLRLARLRKLGDTSLFVSGFLPESLNRRAVGVDYYISMGERAYDALGGAVARRTRGASELTAHRSVFQELAQKFKQLVDLLNEVAERTWLNTNAGVVRLYDRFLDTNSMRLASLLRGHGVMTPIPITVRGGRAS